VRDALKVGELYDVILSLSKETYDNAEPSGIHLGVNPRRCRDWMGATYRRFTTIAHGHGTVRTNKHIRAERERGSESYSGAKICRSKEHAGSIPARPKFRI
jgi:hypothetical protein